MVGMVSISALAIMGDSQECALDLSRARGYEGTVVSTVTAELPLDLSGKLSEGTTLNKTGVHQDSQPKEQCGFLKGRWHLPESDFDSREEDFALNKCQEHEHCDCERTRSRCSQFGSQKSLPRWLVAPPIANLTRNNKSDTWDKKMDYTHPNLCCNNNPILGAQHSRNPYHSRDCSSVPSMDRLSSCRFSGSSDTYSTGMTSPGYQDMERDSRPQSNPEQWRVPPWDNVHMQQSGFYHSRQRELSPVDVLCSEYQHCGCSRKRKSTEGHHFPHNSISMSPGRMADCFNNNTDQFQVGTEFYLSANSNNMTGSVVTPGSPLMISPPPLKIRRDSAIGPGIHRSNVASLHQQQSNNIYNDFKKYNPVVKTTAQKLSRSIASKKTYPALKKSLGGKDVLGPINVITPDIKSTSGAKEHMLKSPKEGCPPLTPQPTRNFKFPGGDPSLCVTVNSLGLCGGSVTVDESPALQLPCSDIKPILDFINPL